MSLATGINADLIYSFTKNPCKYTGTFSFDMFYSYFEKIGIEPRSIMKFQCFTGIDIMDIFYFIYKNIEAFNELNHIRSLTGVNVKGVISESLKRPKTNPIPRDDESIISLILYFKPTREQALAYYTLAKKSPHELFGKAENPDNKLKDNFDNYTKVKMYSFALLSPDYFDSIDEWKEAFSSCLNYNADSSIEIYHNN